MWNALFASAVNGGPWAIAGLSWMSIGLFIARGWLVTRREHENRDGDRKAAIAALEAALAEKDKQISILLGRSAP